jgi:hypothetical protein
MAALGGKHAYRVRLGKDRSACQSRHSIASANGLCRPKTNSLADLVERIYRLAPMPNGRVVHDSRHSRNRQRVAGFLQLLLSPISPAR